MIKRIIKRMKIEKIIDKLGKPKATLITIFKAEMFKFWLRRRATRYAI